METTLIVILSTTLAIILMITANLYYKKSGPKNKIPISLSVLISLISCSIASSNTHGDVATFATFMSALIALCIVYNEKGYKISSIIFYMFAISSIIINLVNQS